MLHVIHTFFISLLTRFCSLVVFFSVHLLWSKAKIPIVTVGNVLHVLRNGGKEANNQGS